MKTKHLKIPFAVKSADESGRVTGYGSVFGNVDLVGDIIERGAFAEWAARQKQTLAEGGNGLPMLWQHNAGEVIGTWDEFTEDDHGLKLSGGLVLETQRGREAHALLKHKAIGGLSIGFSIPEGGEYYDRDRKANVITNVNLFEVSLVTFPANPAAGVLDVKSSPRHVEKLLRDVGFSRNEAKAFIAEGWKGVRRDADPDELSDLLNIIKQATEEINQCQMKSWRRSKAPLKS